MEEFKELVLQKRKYYQDVEDAQNADKDERPYLPEHIQNALENPEDDLVDDADKRVYYKPDISDYDDDNFRDAARNERVLEEECRIMRKKIKILHAALEWCGQKTRCEHPGPTDHQGWSKFLEKEWCL